MRSRTRMKMFLLWLLPLCSCVIFSSHGLAEEETPSDKLARSKSLYLSGEYEDALHELQALKPAVAALEPGEKIDFYVYLGSTLAAFDRLGEAREAFTQALTLDPNLSLNRTKFSPKIVRVFNDAKAAIPFGMLSIKCDTLGADVSLDGKLIGTTPIGSIVGNVLSGEHVLKISKPGFADSVQKVAIMKDQITTIEVNMVAVEKPKAAPTAVTSPTVEAKPPKPGVRTHTWAWVALGGGALLAGGAGVFAALGSSSYDKYRQAGTQGDADRYKAETIRNDWTAVGLGVGALVSWGASTYLFLAKPAPAPTAGVDVRLAVDPLHPGVLAYMTF